MKRIITILVLVSLFVAGDAWAISGRLGEFGVGDSMDVPYYAYNCSGSKRAATCDSVSWWINKDTLGHYAMPIDSGKVTATTAPSFAVSAGRGFVNYFLRVCANAGNHAPGRYTAMIEAWDDTCSQMHIVWWDCYTDSTTHEYAKNNRVIAGAVKAKADSLNFGGDAAGRLEVNMIEADSDTSVVKNFKRAFDGDSTTWAWKFQVRQLQAIADAGNNSAFYLSGIGSGHGYYSLGGPTGYGGYFKAGATGQYGLYAQATNAGSIGFGAIGTGTGLSAIGTGIGIYASGVDALKAVGTDYGILAIGNGAGASFSGSSNGDGFLLTRAGTGYDINLYGDGTIHGAIDSTGGVARTRLALEGTETDTSFTNLQTEVAGIKGKTDNLPASPAATGDAMTLTPAERKAIADTLWLADTSQYSSDDDSTMAGIAWRNKNLFDNQGNWSTATGFATHSAADVWAEDTGSIALTKFGGAIVRHGDYKATGFATHSAADVWSEDTGSVALTKYGGAILDHNDYKATGFATHSAADVWAEDTGGVALTKYGGAVLDHNDYKAADLSVEIDSLLAALYDRTNDTTFIRILSQYVLKHLYPDSVTIDNSNAWDLSGGTDLSDEVDSLLAALYDRTNDTTFVRIISQYVLKHLYPDSLTIDNSNAWDLSGGTDLSVEVDSILATLYDRTNDTAFVLILSQYVLKHLFPDSVTIDNSNAWDLSGGGDVSVEIDSILAAIYDRANDTSFVRIIAQYVLLRLHPDSLRAFLATHDSTLLEQAAACGSGTGPRTVTITVKNAADSVAISGFEVAIYDSSSGEPQANGTTNSNGVYTCSLDDETYTVHITNPPWSLTSPRRFVITGDMDSTFYATRFTPGSPPADSLCVVWGRVKDKHGDPYVGAKVSIWMDAYPVTFGGILIDVATKSVVYTDALGVFEFSDGIYYSSSLNPSNLKWHVRVKTKNAEWIWEGMVAVPSQASWEIEIPDL